MIASRRKRKKKKKTKKAKMMPKDNENGDAAGRA